MTSNQDTLNGKILQVRKRLVRDLFITASVAVCGYLYERGPVEWKPYIFWIAIILGSGFNIIGTYAQYVSAMDDIKGIPDKPSRCRRFLDIFGYQPYGRIKSLPACIREPRICCGCCGSL